MNKKSSKKLAQTPQTSPESSHSEDRATSKASHQKPLNKDFNKDNKPAKELNHKSPTPQKSKKSKADLKVEKKKNRPRWKKWLKRIFITGLISLAVLALTAVGVFAWFAKDLPSADQLESRVVTESTKIYDKSGQHLLYETGKDVRRTYASINDISPYLTNATIALEDKHFYQHRGFDPLGILRSAGINIASNSQVGGSTITQQFVKLAIVGNEKTYSRKIKELILSVELERKYSKDQILEFYLNEVSYGGVNMGVAAAANSYFNKSPKDLTLAEAAVLASIPQRPTYYISQNRDALYERQKYALDRMVEEGYITKEEAEAAKAENITIQQTVAYKDAPHFVDYVLAQLEDDFGGGFMNQGLKVTTTLDYDKQRLAEETIKTGMVNVEKYGGSNAALVSIDAHNGQVLAMVGSKDYYAQDYDGQFNVATSPRQPGSSFKPIAYVTAFANGYNPNTVVFDVKTDFTTDGPTYMPNNYSGRFSGPIALRNALAQSLNIPAVKVLYLVGLDKVLDNAEKLGYTTLQDRSRFGLAVVLGGAEVKLLEHTSAFATFAQEGKRHPVATILKVEDHAGETLYEWTDTQEQVIDQAAVQQLNNVLSDTRARAGFTNLNIAGKTIAAKTGTTNDFHDGWTMMYTPSFATGVWVGNNDNAAMHVGADGSFIAAPIANAYMSKILDDLPDEPFSQPPPAQANKPVLWGQTGIEVEKTVDKDTQKIIPDDCLNTYPEEFKAKKTFKEVHEILHYLRKEDPLGDAPKDPVSDPMYTKWETGVQAWASGQSEYISAKLEYEDCNLRSADQTPTVSITSPADGAKLTPSNFSIKASINPGTGRSIKKVEYIIDTVTVDVRTSPSFDTSYKPSNLTTGKHTVTVKVTNDRDNVAQASSSFSYSTTSTNTNSNTNNKNSNSNSNKNNSNKNSNKNNNNKNNSNSNSNTNKNSNANTNSNTNANVNNGNSNDNTNTQSFSLFSLLGFKL